MRRWSWAGAAAASWVLATQLLAATAGATLPAHTAGTTREFSYNITALPETCSYLRKDVGAKFFEYRAEWSSNSPVPYYCALEISKLYMDGDCSDSRTFTQNKCVSGRTVGGSNASCQAVLRDGSPSWWFPVAPNASDADTLCTASPIGYFYIHNSCNQTFSFVLSIRIQSYISCQLPGQISEGWKLVIALATKFGILALVIVVAVVVCLAVVIAVDRIARCFEKAPPPAVQLVPVGADEAPPSPKPAGEPSTERTPLLVGSALFTSTAHMLPAAAQQLGNDRSPVARSNELAHGNHLAT